MRCGVSVEVGVVHTVGAARAVVTVGTVGDVLVMASFVFSVVVVVAEVGAAPVVADPVSGLTLEREVQPTTLANAKANVAANRRRMTKRSIAVMGAAFGAGMQQFTAR